MTSAQHNRLVWLMDRERWLRAEIKKWQLYYQCAIRQKRTKEEEDAAFNAASLSTQSYQNQLEAVQTELMRYVPKDVLQLF